MFGAAACGYSTASARPAETDAEMTLLGPQGYDPELPVRSRAEIALRLALLICAVGVTVAFTAATIAALAWSALVGAGH